MPASSTMPDPAHGFARACVCVPARNEADALPETIRSLDRQQGAGDGARLRLVILANNCTDGTVDRVRAMERDGDATHLDIRLIEARLAPEVAHVGTARRMAMDSGADWLDEAGVADGVLLSTDADAVAPPDWIAANLRALDDAEIVGGRLLIDAREAADPALAAIHRRIERYWSAVRGLEEVIDPCPHDPAPRHGDHIGASLALRASLYRAVGGLPPLACGEDNALVAAVRRHGGRLRHCPAVSILSSGRMAGRVEGGMATEMARRMRVATGQEEYRLPPVGHWRAAIERRRAFRLAWEAGPGRDAALRALGIGAADLAAIGPCPNAIAFVERIEAHLGPTGLEPAEEPLDAALAGIEALLHELGHPREPALCA